MASDNLQIPDILANQNQKEVTANEATNDLDRAMNSSTSIVVTVSFQLTTTQSRENTLIELTGTPGAAFNVDMPDTNKRKLTILNNTDSDATVRNSAGGGAGQPLILVGGRATFHYDGTDFEDVGVSTLLGLNDVQPSSYVGQAGKAVVVAGDEKGVDFGLAPVEAAGLISVHPKAAFAMVDRTTNFGVPAATSLPVPWQAEVFPQQRFRGLRFWLGPNFTFVDGDVTVATDTITEVGHGFTTGEGPFEFSNAGGALPGGLAASTPYFAIRVDDDNFKPAASYADAIANSPVNITSAAGGGTHTCEKETRLCVPFGVNAVAVNGNANVDQSSFIIVNWKNGGGVDGSAAVGNSAANTDFLWFNLHNDYIKVTGGVDYFEMGVRNNDAGTDNIVAGSTTWMMIRAVETDEVTELVGENDIINGEARVAQRGASGSAVFTATSTFPNNDVAYLFDRWKLLSNGNDIVDVSQETTIKPTGAWGSFKFEVETANAKFGWMQVLSARDTAKYRAGVGSLSFEMRTTTGLVINNVRAAIMEWAGTADSPTADPVSAWSVAGTDPTLVANWTYANTPANIAVTVDAFGRHTIENVAISSGANNIAVFIWVDDTDAAVNDVLYLGDIQLEPRSTATAFIRRQYSEELELCKHHFRKTFDQGVEPAQNSANNNSVLTYRPSNAGVSPAGASWPFGVAMFAAPTVVLYSPGAATTDWWNATATAQASGASGTLHINEEGVYITNAQIANDAIGDDVVIHATADAEIP